MNKVEAIKQACTKLGMSFVYGDLQDANLGLDSLESANYPVFVYVAPGKEKNSQDSPGLVNRVVNVFGYILFSKQSQGLTDTTEGFNYEDVEPLVQQARNLADRLKSSLEKSSITTLNTDGITGWETNSVYAMGDANLFGCDFIVDEWPITTIGCF